MQTVNRHQFVQAIEAGIARVIEYRDKMDISMTDEHFDLLRQFGQQADQCAVANYDKSCAGGCPLTQTKIYNKYGRYITGSVAFHTAFDSYLFPICGPIQIVD